jgi:hypothetical protein
MFIPRATRQLMESLHLRPRRKVQIDIVVYEAMPLFVLDDLHEVAMLALQVGATIQALDVVQKAGMVVGFRFKGCSNPESTQVSLGVTVYATEQKHRVDHHLSLFLPKTEAQYTTHHKEAMKRPEFRSLSEGMDRELSIRKAFTRRAPRRD